MEVAKKVLREVFSAEPTEESSTRLLTPFNEFEIQTTVDVPGKMIFVTSLRRVQLDPKEGARKAQQTCLTFVPGAVIYDEDCFKVVTSSLFLDMEQLEELLRVLLELHRTRAAEVYAKFMDS